MSSLVPCCPNRLLIALDDRSWFPLSGEHKTTSSLETGNWKRMTHDEDVTGDWCRPLRHCLQRFPRLHKNLWWFLPHVISYLFWCGRGAAVRHRPPLITTTIIILIYGHCAYVWWWLLDGHMSCSGGDLKHHLLLVRWWLLKMIFFLRRGGACRVG